MYVFNDIEAILFLGDTSIFHSNNCESYITNMVLETQCYDMMIKQKIKRLVDKGNLNTFTLEEDFFAFAQKQQIKYGGLDILSFANIYFARINNYYLVTSNEMVKECARENNVDVPEIKDVLINLIKEESYVEMFLNK